MSQFCSPLSSDSIPHTKVKSGLLYFCQVALETIVQTTYNGHSQLDVTLSCKLIDVEHAKSHFSSGAAEPMMKNVIV